MTGTSKTTTGRSGAALFAAQSSRSRRRENVVVQSAVEHRCATATLYEQGQVDGKRVVLVKRESPALDSALNGRVGRNKRPLPPVTPVTPRFVSFNGTAWLTRAVKTAVVSLPLTFPVNVPTNPA